MSVRRFKRQRIEITRKPPGLRKIKSRILSFSFNGYVTLIKPIYKCTLKN